MTRTFFQLNWNCDANILPGKLKSWHERCPSKLELRRKYDSGKLNWRHKHWPGKLKLRREACVVNSKWDANNVKVNWSCDANQHENRVLANFRVSARIYFRLPQVEFILCIRVPSFNLPSWSRVTIWIYLQYWFRVPNLNLPFNVRVTIWIYLQQLRDNWVHYSRKDYFLLECIHKTI